ncbi:hypothetical protein ACIQTU_14570 [Brevundimonas sp. NPDC090276]|uniref:hypothetical protein n=1 Tax=Brevundimonas sp. NPDC090276 TaxID=3363956 RepID=UPI00383A6911
MNIGSLFPAPATAKPETTTVREQRQQALAEARLNDARAAVESLKQRGAEASERQKAAAKQKIEQIKARLRMLQMAMIGDPKAAARIAAQLAKELGAAVKAYAAAGGSTAGLGAPATAGAEPASYAVSGEVSSEAQAAAPSAEAPAEDHNDEVALAEDVAEKSANPYQQAIDAAQARINERARRHGETQADRDVLSEVKRLAAQIKAMARQAANKAAGSPEGDEAERAVARMDREINDAVQALPAAGLSLTV